MDSNGTHEWASVVFPADTSELFCKKCGISGDEANGAWGDRACCDEFKEIIESHEIALLYQDNYKLRVFVNRKPGWFKKSLWRCKNCELRLWLNTIHSDEFVIHNAITFVDGRKEIIRHCRELRMRKALT